MTLHLTRHEADRLTADGRVVLFRESESERCAGCDISPRVHRHHDVPPAEFVEAAQPCETCRGRGFNMIQLSPTSQEVAWCTNPDCLDGTRRIAVAVRCARCRGMGVYGNRHNCEDCRASGHVTVGHVVVTWGPCPVIHWDDQVQIATLDEFVVLGSPTDPTWAAHYVRGDDIGRRMGRFTLPPDVDTATLVGQFALGGKLVTP